MLPQKGYLMLRCVALSGCLALLIVEMPLQLPCFVFKAHPAFSTRSENGETQDMQLAAQECGYITYVLYTYMLQYIYI